MYRILKQTNGKKTFLRQGIVYVDWILHIKLITNNKLLILILTQYNNSIGAIYIYTYFKKSFVQDILWNIMDEISCFEIVSHHTKNGEEEEEMIQD